MKLRLRLVAMNFLEFAVWGAYLTSMANYLDKVGLFSHNGLFYSMQGVVSIFMPAIMGVVADRWVPAQRLLALCHFLAAAFMAGVAYYGFAAGADVQYHALFALYSLSVAFYMPTLALSNAVAYSALNEAGIDTVKAFPPIRVFGTVGFICSMQFIDIAGLQASPMQFAVSATLSFILAIYALTLPSCPVSRSKNKKSFVDAFGLRAFALFKQKRFALFFIFSTLLGVSLQITNGFANPFITSFKGIAEYEHTFGANHANILLSLSQVSETLCILLIPFFMKRFGIKRVMLIAMFAWVLRFGLFGAGNPGDGVWMFVLSMIVYGVAFDFFNISGSLFVDNEADTSIRSSAQGLFFLMTNGIGATIGTLAAQKVVNHFVLSQTDGLARMAGWSTSWYIFAAYALVVALLFAACFKATEKKE